MADPPAIAPINPIKAPAAPAKSTPPTLAFTSCTSDDEAFAKVPSRNMDDPAYKQRGFRKPAGWFPSTRPPTPGNEVIPYVYGKCVFADMAEALKTAFLPEHRIYI